MPNVTLFEFGPTRSARCRWTLLEAGLEFESVDRGPALIGSADVKEIHPLGKIPAAVIDGKPLFESAAIATAIADRVPDKDLIARPGSWGRALHDQWVSFALTELEAWCWSTAVNTFVLPEEQRVTAHLEQNQQMFNRGASALDTALSGAEYLVEDRFTVTDIIVGYTVNFGSNLGFLDDFSHLRSYLNRLKQREHCPLG